jgi:hypothetical protein
MNNNVEIYHVGRTITLESVLRILLDHRRRRTTCLATRRAIRATVRRIRELRETVGGAAC